jgi:hypothetical protein
LWTADKKYPPQSLHDFEFIADLSNDRSSGGTGGLLAPLPAQIA